MNPTIHTFFHTPTFTACHVIVDPEAKRAAIVDSALDFDLKSGRTHTKTADEIVAFVHARGLTVDWVLETHVHADHLTAARYLKSQLGGRKGIGRDVGTVQETFVRLYNAPDVKTDGSQFDRLFADGETFAIGGLQARVVATPGHTPACITYVVGDAAFVGDTLFMQDYGTARCDFPGGDAATLYRSIQKIFALPPETRLFMCHDYKAPGRDHFVWETTVAEQRAHNIHIHDGISEAEFVAMREKRDATLEMPVLLWPAVQVNMRAGHLPPKEDNGLSYLKIPLNAV